MKTTANLNLQVKHQRERHTENERADRDEIGKEKVHT